MASNVVDAMGSVDTEQTTVFVSDANVVTSTVMKPMQITSALYKTNDMMTSQSVKAFLAKEVKVTSGVFSTTDTVSTFTPLYNPQNIITTVHSTKLQGYMGFRATVRIRIVFNASRFQMGRYMLVHVPYGGAGTSTKSTDWYNSHTNSKMQRTQLQRVEFDVSCDTEAILEIPYVSALSYFPITALNDANGVGTLGRFCIYPYFPLSVDTGTPTVSYTMYSSFHDVELVGAAVPQSGRMGKTKKNASEQEQKSKQIGPVESVMNVGFQVSSALTTVPLLSHFATPASWIFDALRGTAAHFGWSKPINLSTTNRVVTNYAPYFGSVDNDDMSLPLSSCVSNQVDPALGFSGTDIDEMDFKFIATIPAYFSQVNWATGDAVGATVFSLPIYPGYYANTRATLPAVTDFTPVAFCSNYFRYWRGSLVFKFKFVRTEFHSGRLNFAYFPYDENSSAAAVTSHATSAYLNRHIVDIRECNEVTLTIPYLSSSPWMDSLNDASCGTFICYIEDKLMCPSTVPQYCGILMEIAGGPDIEFAQPVPVNVMPSIRAVPQSGVMSRAEPANECNLVSSSIGGSHVVEDDVINAGFCIGEKISSFRTLVKSFGVCATTAVATSTSYKNFIPFAWSNVTVDLVTPVTPFTTSDLYGTLCSIFLFSRGGVRLKMLVLNDSASTQNVKYLMAYLNPQIYGGGAGTKLLDAAGTTTDAAAANPNEFCLGPKVIARVADGQPLEVSVPQYAKYHSRVNTDHAVSVTNPYSFSKGSLATGTFLDVQPMGVVAFNAYRAMWFRAGADDCNFGGFISIPPMATTAGFATN